MYILQAEPRSTGLRSKHLRQKGLIPGCVYGGDINGSLLLQIEQSEANKLMRSKTRGGRVLLNVKGEKFNTLLREIDRNPVTDQIRHLSFQKLNGDELVSSTAQIVLVNKEKIPVYIQQVLFEIPYRALASKLIEKIEIDLEGMQAGDSIKVKDLDICNNDDIEILADSDSLVLSIISNRRTTQQPQSEEV
ncbi:MAG: 50S ribosomal protein L25 [Oscillospiraceae bacterium]|jgi:large subunit ribosomal protein L25